MQEGLGHEYCNDVESNTGVMKRLTSTIQQSTTLRNAAGVATGYGLEDRGIGVRGFVE